MPIYLYQEILPGGQPGPVFEWMQPVSAPALTRHPESGHPVRKLPTTPSLTLRYGEGSQKHRLDARSVEKAGFTRYDRDRLTGRYHKVAGRDSRAPDVLSPQG